MTASTKTDPSRVTTSRRQASDPALSEVLCISLPSPARTASCRPACSVGWRLGRVTSLATRLGKMHHCKT